MKKNDQWTSVESDKFKSMKMSDLIGKHAFDSFIEKCIEIDIHPERVVSHVVYDFIDGNLKQSDFINMTRTIHNGLVNLHWSNEVKKRDNYSCLKCGSVFRVTAHHIIPIKRIIDIENIDNLKKIETSKLLKDISNGITLCLKCHHKAHKTL